MTCSHGFGGPTSTSTAAFAETPPRSSASLIADSRTDSATFGSVAILSNSRASLSVASSSRSRAAFLLTYLARQCGGKGRDDLLFPGSDGTHLRRPHPVSGWFAKAVAASGIPHATPHDLRHTAASLEVSAGANVKAVQKMLGHASAAMTLDVYADLFSDDLEAVATVLDAARSRESVPKVCPRGAENNF
jgi:site-specific recombinase XerC